MSAIPPVYWFSSSYLESLLPKPDKPGALLQLETQALFFSTAVTAWENFISFKARFFHATRSALELIEEATVYCVKHVPAFSHKCHKLNWERRSVRLFFERYAKPCMWVVRSPPWRMKCYRTASRRSMFTLLVSCHTGVVLDLQHLPCSSFFSATLFMNEIVLIQD